MLVAVLVMLEPASAFLPTALHPRPHALSRSACWPRMLDEADTAVPPAGRTDRRAILLGAAAGGVGLTLTAAFGLASLLGWDLAPGDSDNRGMGKPLSREESAELRRGGVKDEECAVEVGKALSARCRELQEEERALWGVVSGTDLRAK